MFEQFFKRPHALARQRNGPLAEERLRYLAHCSQLQMAPGTLRFIALYTLIVANSLRLAATQVYLTMTPELLHQAGKRFERYARGEDGHA